MDASVQTYEVESPQYRPRVLAFGAISGAIQTETLTCPAFADASQGDFVLIHNQAGQTCAAWLDLDADGTPPTAEQYVNADFQIKVSIVTGDDEEDVASALVSAVSGNLPDVTLTDNSDGTVTVTQDLYGACEPIAAYDEDASGSGSFSVSVVDAGVDPSMGEGKFDGTITQPDVGQLTITFKKEFRRSPEIGIVSKTAGLVPRIVSSSTTAITVELQDVSTGDPDDGSCGILVVGSDHPDAI